MYIIVFNFGFLLTSLYSYYEFVSLNLVDFQKYGYRTAQINAIKNGVTIQMD